LPFSVPYYLGIAVNGGQESTPRIPLSMSPYALSVRGTTNTFPNDGNVIVGNDLNVTGETTLNNYWHFENTNELNADGTMYLNYGGNDVDISHTGGTTTTGGDLNVGGNVKVNNHIMNDANGDYDVWIQGSTGSTNAGDDRNLAILGYSDDSYDALILNYNNEYENGVRVQSKLQVDGSIQVGGGSVLGGIETGSIGSGSPGSTGPKYFVANHWRQL